MISRKALPQNSLVWSHLPGLRPSTGMPRAAWDWGWDALGNTGVAWYWGWDASNAPSVPKD